MSGGYDSRGILSMFHLIGKNLKNVKSITWGLKEGLSQPGNDAYVAKKLAKYYDIEHKYYLTDLSKEPIEKIFHRFLICGEGRIDHISGYMDGFQIWKTLCEDKVQGIIRGDEGFGWVSVNSPSDVRSRIGISLCTDFTNLKGFEELGLLQPELPEYLKKRENESLETWRDRLYHQFRMPVVLAGLTDLKLPYVEVINPLLSRRIVYQMRTISDHLRTGKSLFKKIVNSISPNIGYASSGANSDAGFIFKSREAVDLFRSELISENCNSVMPKGFASYLMDNLVTTDRKVNIKQRIKSLLKRYLPTKLIRKASDFKGEKAIAVNTLAFRTYMICKMNQILIEDASSSERIETADFVK